VYNVKTGENMDNNTIVEITTNIMKEENFMDITKLLFFTNITSDENLNMEEAPLAFVFSPEENKYVITINKYIIKLYLEDISSDKLKEELIIIISNKIRDSMIRGLEEAMKKYGGLQPDKILTQDEF
jgi:hypothetical protein